MFYRMTLLGLSMFSLMTPSVCLAESNAKHQLVYEQDGDPFYLNAEDKKVAEAWRFELTMDIPALVAKTKKNMVFLKGSTFLMGDWGGPSGLPYEAEDDSKPVHKVTLDSFSMQKYKVTYAEFDVFTEATHRPNLRVETFNVTLRKPNFPAGVNWFGAKAYCQWLGEITKLPFDLPTEAQWEYAARSGGKKMLYATDNGKYEPGRNYPSDDQREQLTGKDGARNLPIGKFPPNGIGLYDMANPTREWVDDWYGPYTEKPQRNPKGPLTGELKVIKAFMDSTELTFTFSRHGMPPRGVEAKYVSNPEELETKDFMNAPGNSFRCVLNSKQPLK